MGKVLATTNRLMIQERIYIYMIIYYIMLGSVCYAMIQDPDITIGIVFVGVILLGLFFGKPYSHSFIYDRQNNCLIRESNYSFFKTQQENADTPVKWVIDAGYISGDGPNFEANILLKGGRQFLFSMRKEDVDILVSYVSQWEDVEVFYYKYGILGGRKQTAHRIYRKKETPSST